MDRRYTSPSIDLRFEIVNLREFDVEPLLDEFGLGRQCAGVAGQGIAGEGSGSSATAAAGDAERGTKLGDRYLSDAFRHTGN